MLLLFYESHTFLPTTVKGSRYMSSMLGISIFPAFVTAFKAFSMHEKSFRSPTSFHTYT